MKRGGSHRASPIIRILDRNGKGNTKNIEAVAKAMIPQGVDINILCRLFQHQCHQRAVFRGLNRYLGAESVVLLFSISTAPADRDIDC